MTHPIPDGSGLPPPTAGAAVDLHVLGLCKPLLRAAAALGWTQATPVQQAVLPAALQGRDVLAQAPTGAGKTGAYVLPLLHPLLASAEPLTRRPLRLRALVLVPTRELAAQVRDTVRSLAPQVKTVLAVGGASINPQLMALRGGAHVVVATPGRLLDLHRHNALALQHLGLLVLDEADRLLDLGFADDVAQVLALLPRRRQTLLLSATLPPAVQALAARAQHDALQVNVAAQVAAGVAGDEGPAAAPRIQQRAVQVELARRTPLLRHLIDTQGWRRVLVFVATQYATEHVADKLRQGGVAAAALHGRLSLGRRAQVLADLHRGELQVLVATDLAARGLDIPGLDVVVNHDLPRSAVDHLHRIGRTGRAGEQGVAVSLVAVDLPGAEAQFRLIERRQQQRVPREQVPGFEPRASAVAVPLDSSGGVKGRRKSKKDKLREAAAAAVPEAAAAAAARTTET